MREKESGVILFITYYYEGGGGGGGGGVGKCKVSIVYSIRMGGGGGEGGRTEVPLCSLSQLIAVDNLKLRIDCPPLNNE